MGTSTATDVTTEALVATLASLPVETLEAVRLGVANERTMCAQAYAYSADGVKKPVGCLMAAAVWHSPDFQQSIKGLTKHEASDMMLAISDSYDIVQHLHGDTDMIDRVIAAYDFWAANREFNVESESNDMDDARKLGAKRTRRTTRKYEDGETSTIEMLKPEAKRELLSIVNQAITQNLAA